MKLAMCTKTHTLHLNAYHKYIRSQVPLRDKASQGRKWRAFAFSGREITCPSQRGYKSCTNRSATVTRSSDTMSRVKLYKLQPGRICKKILTECGQCGSARMFGGCWALGAMIIWQDSREWTGGDATLVFDAKTCKAIKCNKEGMYVDLDAMLLFTLWPFMYVKLTRLSLQPC